VKENTVALWWQDSGLVRQFNTAVCLHGHTMYSEECLDFLPRYLKHVPVVSQFVSDCQRRGSVDFARAYWTPPLTPSSALGLEQEQIAGLGLRGLKFHPQYMTCAVDDPRCLRIARAAASAGLSFTLHAGYHPCFPKHDEGSPRRLRRLHDAVPELRIIACHLGGMGDWQGVVDCIVGTDIYLETSFAPSWCPREVWDIILARHDPHRIVFGTDSPWQDQAKELMDFSKLPLSAEALELALPLLDNSGVRAEAAVAVKKIAEAIKAQHPKAAQEALSRLQAKP